MPELFEMSEGANILPLPADGKRKLRVLAWGDYCCSTGFATVMSNIMRQLEASGKYEIDVVGINHSGDPYDRDKFPGNVWPAMSALNMGGAYGDVFGRQKLLDLLGRGDYDILFMLQDTFIVRDMLPAVIKTQGQTDRPFKVIYYFPFDAAPKREWVEDVVSKVDYPVTYTEYAKALCLAIDPKLKQCLGVIYHGTNLEDFNYVDNRADIDQFRKHYFSGKADGKFLITNINRNQSRKDIIRNLMILAELKRRGHNDIMLYLHMSHEDQGGNILVMADHFNLKLGVDYFLPSPKVFNPHTGLPIGVLNLIYNASDMMLTTTLGEGWGLSLTEAMATKTPIVAPDHTSITEILADNRGLLVPAGETPTNWIMKEQDNERLRPLMNVEKAADAIESIKRGERPDVEKAYAWAQQLSWEVVGQSWIKVFDAAAEDAEKSAKGNRAQRRAIKQEV